MELANFMSVMKSAGAVWVAELYCFCCRCCQCCYNGYCVNFL